MDCEDLLDYRAWLFWLFIFAAIAGVCELVKHFKDK
jgi:hypothetical protein